MNNAKGLGRNYRSKPLSPSGVWARRFDCAVVPVWSSCFDCDGARRIPVENFAQVFGQYPARRTDAAWSDLRDHLDIPRSLIDAIDRHMARVPIIAAARRTSPVAP